MTTLWGKHRYLFVLGHMRSYSTLLAHLLGSHPRVRGYAEQHLSYDSIGALKKLRRNLDLEAFPGKQARDGYLLDKLLHDDLALADFISSSPTVFVVFLLREPLATLRSISAFMADFPPQRALAYYVARLERLRSIAERPTLEPRRVVYLDADRLLDDGSSVLAALTAFLELDPPLAERYQLFARSGIPGAGDISTRLQLGYIAHQPRRHDVVLPEAVTEAALRAHRTCRAALLRRFRSIAADDEATATEVMPPARR